MPTPATTPPGSFKRQVVFRISPDDSPLLDQATREHGSIQAAILAGLHALIQQPPAPNGQPEPAKPTPTTAATAAPSEPEAEINAREAARILGLKPDTVSSYIRSGRLPGHYRDTLGSSGWVTNRTAIAAYQKHVQAAG